MTGGYVPGTIALSSLRVTLVDTNGEIGPSDGGAGIKAKKSDTGV